MNDVRWLDTVGRRLGMLPDIVPLAFFRVAMMLGAPALRSAVGRYRYSLVAGLAKREFEDLLPGLPDIGGMGNPRSVLLFAAAFFLALDRAIGAAGHPVDNAGELYVRIVDQAYSRVPKWLVGLYGQSFFGSAALRRAHTSAQRSELRRHEADWVFRFVPGDGQTFDWGFDFVECGIIKYLKREGAERLAPHMCELDFTASRHLGWGLKRTSELANGGARCDFRFTRQRQ